MQPSAIPFDEATPDARSGAEIAASIVIPTYNEAKNVPVLVERLREVMGQRSYEIIVVDDDSPDLTWSVANRLGEEDPRVRCHRRIDRKGLGSAIVDGLSLGRGERLVVMDADLQHDPAAIPRLLDALDDADLALGTRYGEGGSTGEWGIVRELMSRGATIFCRVLLGITATDPMSGLFAIRRDLFHELAPRLNPRGFKILMEVLYHTRNRARVAEVDYTFGLRHAGESKLDKAVILDFVLSAFELRSGGLVSRRFLKYCAVGLLGVAVQTIGVYLLNGPLTPPVALATAIAAAMLHNYLLNNIWTFRDRRHREATALLSGLVRFVFVSGFGALINHSVTTNLFQLTGVPMHLTSLAGIAMATAWNFLLNSRITWDFGRKDE